MPRSSFPNTAALTPAEGVLSTIFDTEVVLLNPANGVYYGLSDVGARVWTLVERSKPIARIRDTILSEYDVDAKRCAADLDRLIADLIDHGLVVLQRT